MLSVHLSQHKLSQIERQSAKKEPAETEWYLDQLALTSHKIKNFENPSWPQIVQSAMLSIQSSELGPPPHRPQESVAPPPGSKGRYTCLGGGGGAHFDDRKETLVQYSKGI